jgi:hypothetical protein
MLDYPSGNRDEEQCGIQLLGGQIIILILHQNCNLDNSPCVEVTLYGHFHYINPEFQFISVQYPIYGHLLRNQNSFVFQPLY